MANIKTGNIVKVGVILIMTLMLNACGNSKDAEQVPVGKVMKGAFYIDMYEEGELEAVNSISISAPSFSSWRYSNLKITQIVKDGEEVNTGDTVVMFDPSEVYKGITEAESGLEISVAELEKMEAQHKSDLEELNVDYESTRLSLEISKIEFERAAYESEMKKKEMQLNLDKAYIALDKAKEQIENRKSIQAEEMKQKQLAIEQDRLRLSDAKEALAKLSVVSPSPGIAILSHNWSTGNKFQPGDQCWSGRQLVLLPDLSKMKATVKINEVDIAKVEKGLKVEVKPDAFSDRVFTGYVNSVANLAVNKDRNSKIKVFPVEVMLNETDKDLLPGLTIGCRLIIDQIDDVVYIPLDALRTEGDTEFVYKKRGKGYDRVEVETGRSNSDYVIIEKGLKEGDDIALADPYANKDTGNGTEGGNK